MAFKKGQSGNPDGRPKGSANKENKLLREMILEALERKGGVEYLAKQAEEHPGPFMSLLAKVLPTQVTGEGGGPMHEVRRIELVALRAGTD